MNSRPTTSPSHWSEVSEAGALWGMKALLGAYRLGGNWLFKPLLAPVILYFYLRNKHGRKASADYLKRVQKFCHIPPRPLPLGLRHFWQFGCALLDKVACWSARLSYADVDLFGREQMLDLIERGQGGVIITSHFGNFEMCRALQGQNFPELKLTILVHTKHASKFNQLLKKASHSDSIELLQVTEISPATAMMLAERVERGGFIAIAGDRVSIGNPEADITAEFLGQPARFPRGPYILAAILKAPLIALNCFKQHGRYQIHFDCLSPELVLERRLRDARIAKLAQTYAQLLQHYCLQQPLQWFNFYDFWSEHD